MIIDFHTHCFPDKIYRSAITSMCQRTGEFHHYADGSLSGLKKALAASGVDGAVVLNVATNPAKVAPVNDFAAAVNDPGGHIYGFGSVHPAGADPFAELERMKALGLRGVKFQPAFQDFYADDKRVFELYRYINKLGLIAVFHCGEDLGFADCFITPAQLAAAMPCFPDVPVVAAHFGGYMLWREVEKNLLRTGVYLDTAYSYSHIPTPIAKMIARSFGPERILFGTDSPWCSMDNELMFIRGLGFTDSGLEAVLGGNAMRLLK